MMQEAAESLRNLMRSSPPAESLVYERSARHSWAGLSGMRNAPRRPASGSAADRPLASPTPRTALPAEPQLLQLRVAPVGRSTGGSQAGRQDQERAQAGRATRTSRIASPSAPTRPGAADRPLRADDLRPMPGPLARATRTGRPRAELAPGRRTAPAGGHHHRASRSRADLPLLWPSQSG